MKKFKNLLFSLSIIGLFSLGFWACNNQEITSPSGIGLEGELTDMVVTSTQPNIYFRHYQPTTRKGKADDGYLVFKTSEEFEMAKDELMNASYEEILDWEAQFVGFTSMRSLYQAAMDAEAAWAEEIEQMDEKALEKLAKSGQKYSKFLEKNKEKFKFVGAAEILKPDVINSVTASLVNQDGLVKVAGHLIQFGYNYTKVIELGDEQKILAMQKAKKTDKAKGVYVKKVNHAGKEVEKRMTNFNASNSDPVDLVHTCKNYHALTGFLDISAYSTPRYDCANGYWAPIPDCDPNTMPDGICEEWICPFIGFDERQTVETTSEYEKWTHFPFLPCDDGAWSRPNADFIQQSVNLNNGDVRNGDYRTNTNGYSFTHYDEPVILNFTFGVAEFNSEKRVLFQSDEVKSVTITVN